MASAFLSRSQLEQLAPGRLPMFADTRYDGGGQSASVTDFPSGDARDLRVVYQAIRDLCQALRAINQAKVLEPLVLNALLQRPEWGQILQSTKTLGTQLDLPEALHSIVHDVRGGSLLGLIGSAHLVDPNTATPNEVLRLFCYARDHLKIMRNCLPDIDPDFTQHDHEATLHPASLYRDKWTNARMEVSGNYKQVALVSDFDGDISTRCQEFSAIDRIIYNFFNNAARYGEGHDVQIDIFVPPGPEESNVRFTIQNEIAPAQAARIAALTQEDVNRLLQGGLSTSGSGLGLRICTDFITRAFGLQRVNRAVAEKYIGLEISGTTFVAWFHWPKV